ncbi:hypothetical protein E2C01_094472 [Portunus trituberculatus]|uniref:Uncharacterized protein n=1 Tax=Portunus trituberculatus TaxID=210409 RepID=A0A5B7K0T0_PORTR|nr:hypothetical protein [Portunus trituberculatus]
MFPASFHHVLLVNGSLYTPPPSGIIIIHSPVPVRPSQTTSTPQRRVVKEHLTSPPVWPWGRGQDVRRQETRNDETAINKSPLTSGNLRNNT